jgi:hypothetical protein
MLLAKVVVRPDNDVFIIWVSLDLIIRSSGKGVCTICCPRFVFEYDIILLPFREVSCNAWADLAGVAVLSEVCVVGVDYDRDRRPF